MTHRFRHGHSGITRARWLQVIFAGLCASVFTCSATALFAGTLGHYAGSSWPEQSVFTAPPGWYTAFFYTGYHSERAKDASGNTVSSVNIGGRTVPVEANTTAHSFAAVLTYGSTIRLLGARYGFIISPSYGDTAFQTRVGNAERGFDVGGSGSGLGDTLIIPLQLTWSVGKFDHGFQYGMWAPTGKYTANSSDNVGLGFWSQDVRYSIAYYPGSERWKTAIIGSLVWEWNGKLRGVDLRPGQSLTAEVALNHFLSPQWSAAIFGHGQWQITDDSGGAANPGMYRVFAAGLQGNFNATQEISFYARAWFEFEAHDRFEGQFLQAGMGYKFL